MIGILQRGHVEVFALGLRLGLGPAGGAAAGVSGGAEVLDAAPEDVDGGWGASLAPWSHFRMHSSLNSCLHGRVISCCPSSNSVRQMAHSKLAVGCPLKVRLGSFAIARARRSASCLAPASRVACRRSSQSSQMPGATKIADTKRHTANRVACAGRSDTPNAGSIIPRRSEIARHMPLIIDFKFTSPLHSQPAPLTAKAVFISRIGASSPPITTK